MADADTAVHCWVPGSISLRPTGRGPLDGTSAAVKDLVSIAGHTSSFGHPRWRATHPPSTRTAPVLAAGAAVAGLAKLDQLAYSLVGNVGEGTAPGAVVVVPVLPGLPPLRRASLRDLAAFRSGCLAFTAASSLTGGPELVIPVRHLPSGHTFGAGILAPVHGDATLLHLAGMLCPDGGPVEVG